MAGLQRDDCDRPAGGAAVGWRLSRAIRPLDCQLERSATSHTDPGSASSSCTRGRIRTLFRADSDPTPVCCGIRVVLQSRVAPIASGLGSWFSYGGLTWHRIRPRNMAHLRYKASILVLCRGRPASANVNNVGQMWDSEGVPNFTYVVESAGLLATQQARHALDEKGVVHFHDLRLKKTPSRRHLSRSSAELGWTTADSSSLPSGPAGRTTRCRTYTTLCAQHSASHHASLEFQANWDERAKSGWPYSLLSDDI